MSDRTLPGPVRALTERLTMLTRGGRVGSTRQVWPGRILQVENVVVPGTVRTTFALNEFWRVAVLYLPAGGWAIQARTVLTVLNNSGATHYTGQEMAQARLYIADAESLVEIEEVDLVFAQPSATPEGAYAGGALDLPLPMFGHAMSEVPFAIEIIAQAVDPEGSTACTWTSKIMAVPA